MKLNITIVLLVLSIALCGCNTLKNTAPKVLASTALAVDAAMKAWAVWVVEGHATAEQEQNVRDMYKKYQISMLIAYNAYTQSVASGEQTAWQQASTVLTNNKVQLISLIQLFMTDKSAKLSAGQIPTSAIDHLPPQPPSLSAPNVLVK